MKKINVIISSDNKHAVSDSNAHDWYKSLKDGDNAYVATSIMFNELRIGVTRKEIAPFSFSFRGKILNVGENGELVSDTRCWPNGFFDEQSIQVRMLMNGKDREQVAKDIENQKTRYNQSR